MYRTSVDHLELGDDVEPHVGELVLEELEEEGEEVLDGRVLAEEGRESRDLSAEGGANVLRLVGREVADAGHEASENHFAVDELSEA